MTSIRDFKSIHIRCVGVMTTTMDFSTGGTFYIDTLNNVHINYITIDGVCAESIIPMKNILTVGVTFNYETYNK